MSKLKAVVHFELATSQRYLLIFYCIEFSMVAVTLLLTWLGRGSVDEPYFAALELCAMIFIFIFGIFGFAEDFKMLLQNGYTRCYIFIATLMLFLQTAVTLALVDTLAARLLEGVAHGYWSLFTAIYGPDHALWLQGLWRFGVYVSLVSVGYLCALTVTRLGTKRALILGIALWCAGVVILPLAFREWLPDALRYDIGTGAETFIYHCAGFTAEGVQLINPLLSLSALTVLGFAICFALMRRAPLR